MFPLRGRVPGRRTYGERLQDELSFTPVHVRYNTGLHISDNGRALAALLDEVVDGLAGARSRRSCWSGTRWAAWSSRSACHYGEVDGRRWTDVVRHVFCLGSPAPGRRSGEGRQRRSPRGSAGCPRRARWRWCSTPAASASRTCASARAPRRTGATATPTSSSRPQHRGPVPAGRGLLLHRRDAAAQGRSARCSATCSSACRARRAAGTARAAASRSRSTTATSSPASTTSIC